MRMVSSLYFLRLFFITSSCLFIYQLYHFIVINYNYDHTTEVIEEKLSWNDINFENPPYLNSSDMEKLRLNELLAVKQFSCEKPLVIEDRVVSTVICEEFGELENGLLISGNSFLSGKLEKSLNISKWSVFLPEESTLIDSLAGDVEVNYLTEISSWKQWQLWDIFQTLKQKKTFSFVRLDLYSNFFNNYDQADIVKQMMEVMDVKYLMLTVHVDTEGEKATLAIAEWYRLLFYLFYRKSYAITRAVSSGSCGFNSDNCRYHVSLVKLLSKTPRNAPVFGLGSPLEERKRLLSLLKTSKYGCSVISSSSFPSFCNRKWNKQSNIMLISYKSGDISIPVELEKVEEIRIINPNDIRLTNNKTMVNINKNGISINNRTSTNESWKLETLDSLTSKLSTIDLLLLQLEGGEWDVLPDLLKLVSVKTIQQICIDGRLFIEENNNYRTFYWNLYQLRQQGYNLSFCHWNNNNNKYDCCWSKTI